MTAARQPAAEVRRVRAAVLERDRYRCVRCGITNDQHKAVYARQLSVWRLDPGAAYTVDGCVTACRGCNVNLTKRKGGRAVPPSPPRSKPAPGSPKRKYDRGAKK